MATQRQRQGACVNRIADATAATATARTTTTTTTTTTITTTTRRPISKCTDGRANIAECARRIGGGGGGRGEPQVARRARTPQCANPLRLSAPICPGGYTS
ncbi:hypothetical protein EAG_13857 [Camponotus floridanus]|uniref:Uncharacterized protein n=1 Tax=Camponotus floridanus TaxID=104421 RepID=E2AVJ1_CAMFO|nr:hypothetical protein EAG_13857 [Camponotus floridanus]